MEGNKQVQKAGDGSQQLQMVNPTFNIIGISEERAREIFNEMNAIARQNYTQDAYEIATERVRVFEELLMNKVKQVDGMLETFREPSFQFLLVKAQQRAAASERESDFELLTELLAHRVEKTSDRKIKASISKAVEIVDQIDDDALCGLTMAYAINDWAAITGNITNGFKVMDDMLSSLCYRELPTGYVWIYHLDILDAVRISSIVSVSIFKKFAEYYPDVFEGYTCVGIQKDSENYINALKILTEAQLPASILVDHELNEGYVRLFVRDRNSIADIEIASGKQGVILSQGKVTQQQVDALNDIWKLYSTDPHLTEQVKQAFMERWDSYDSLRAIREWWEAIPHGFTITPIGEVLAHANAQKYYHLIPRISTM